ncbi:hypothetical protein CHCC15332_1342 [Bacillus paralicheniformis]|nr:hypothetical protein CHCC15332_1342 [Bacillus paralicheniformis]
MNQIITGQYQKNRKKLPKTDMIRQLYQWAIITGFIRRKKEKESLSTLFCREKRIYTLFKLSA